MVLRSRPLFVVVVVAGTLGLGACPKPYRAVRDAEPTPAARDEARPRDEVPVQRAEGAAADRAVADGEGAIGSVEPQGQQGQGPQGQGPQGQEPQGQGPQGQGPQGQGPQGQGQGQQGQQRPGQAQQRGAFAPDLYPPGTVYPASLDLTPIEGWGVDGKVKLPRKNEGSSMGTNLTFMKDYSGEYTFVDAFKQSRPWFSGRSREALGGPVWEERKRLDLDDRGWVRSLEHGQVARTLFFYFDNRLKYPSGNYILLYEGDGQMELTNAQVSDSRPGRMVVTVDARSGGFGLTITATNPKNYLRNMRLIMPGGVCKADPYKWCKNDGECGSGACQSFEQTYRTQLFHPTFLDRLKTYGAIRYKDWQDVDMSRHSEWAHRPKLTDARWTRYGVPIEVIVELSNRLHVDTWINVPHLASDAYVTELATYVRDHLDPSSKIYVEHSNEVWNGIFESARHLVQKAQEQGIGRDPNQGAILLHSRRSRELFAIFEKVLGGRQRLVRVLASHPGNAWWTEQLLTQEDAYKQADAVAITGYFGHRLGHPDNALRLKTLPMEQVMDEVEQQSKMTIDFQRPQFELAKRFKLQLLAYEGGEHLTALGPMVNDTEVNAMLDRASRHPRMKQIYLDHFARWKEAGGGMFMHFVNCAIATNRLGRFGALSYLDQPREAAPKFDALQEFIEKTPRWW